MSDKNPLAYTGLISASTKVQGDAQFNSSQFSVVDGVVSLSGGGLAMDTAATDSGNAVPTAAGVITWAGGTNIATAGSGSTVTINMDAAISLATSVTSPLYLAPAATAMEIRATAGQNMSMQMGDAGGVNKISFEDSASAEVASLDSNGVLAVSGMTSTGTSNFDGTTNINDSFNSNTLINTGTSTGTVSIGNALAGAITADTAAGISLDGATASNFTVTGAVDLTLASTLGAVIVSSGEAAADAIQLTASDAAGGVTAAVGTGNFNVSGGDLITSRSSASGEVTVEVTNSDNTAADSDAFFEVAVGGTSSGNPGVRFQISGGQNYSMGIDNASASDDLLICGDNDIGTDALLRIEEAGNVTVEKGNLIINTAAKQLQIQGGAATDFIGSATLTAGTVTVANTNIAAGDKILLSRQSINGSTVLGMLTYAITASTNFIITAVQTATPAATETNDISIIDYVIVRQI